MDPAQITTSSRHDSFVEYSIADNNYSTDGIWSNVLADGEGWDPYFEESYEDSSYGNVGGGFLIPGVFDTGFYASSAEPANTSFYSPWQNLAPTSWLDPFYPFDGNDFDNLCVAESYGNPASVPTIATSDFDYLCSTSFYYQPSQLNTFHSPDTSTTTDGSETNFGNEQISHGSDSSDTDDSARERTPSIVFLEPNVCYGPRGARRGRSTLPGSGERILHLDTNIKRQRDKRYECKCDLPSGDKCGRRFIRSEHLTRHKKIHTGVQDFKCRICGKLFGRRDNCYDHYWTHVRRPGRNGSNRKLPLADVEDIVGDLNVIRRLREKFKEHSEEYSRLKSKL